MKDKLGEFTVAIAAVFAFVSLVWFFVWKDEGVMETLYYAAQLTIAIAAAGIATTLFIFYGRPAIKELLQRDFWISTAFAVTFALMGFREVIGVLVPVTQLGLASLGSSMMLAIWFVLLWLFLMKRLMIFAGSPTIEEAIEARAVIKSAEEAIRKAKEIE